MSKLYGMVQGAGKTAATRRGHSTITTTAATWRGAIEVTIYIDAQGVEHFEVTQRPWHGEGIREALAYGIVGQPTLYRRDVQEPDTQAQAAE